MSGCCHHMYSQMLKRRFSEHLILSEEYIQSMLFNMSSSRSRYNCVGRRISGSELNDDMLAADFTVGRIYSSFSEFRNASYRNLKCMDPILKKFYLEFHTISSQNDRVKKRKYEHALDVRL